MIKYLSIVLCLLLSGCGSSADSPIVLTPNQAADTYLSEVQESESFRSNGCAWVSKDTRELSGYAAAYWNKFAASHGLETITEQEAAILSPRDIERTVLAVKAKLNYVAAADTVTTPSGKTSRTDEDH